MSEVQCPCCLKRITDIEEEFESEPSAEADVDAICPHCNAPLRLHRRVEYSADSATT